MAEASIDTPASYSEAEIAELNRIARQVRADILRTVASSGAGHVGGPLSATDMLVALYFKIMRIKLEDPKWEDRDRFVLSKGHSSLGLYSTLASRGFIPREELATFDHGHSRLQGHPDMTKLDALDMSTGSLGQGISAAVGMALGAKLKGKHDIRVYCMVGDGENQEGQVWEAAFIAQRYKLDNLIVLLDFNKLQQFGWRGDSFQHRLPPWDRKELPDKWRAFGWRVIEIDGHDMPQILNALSTAREQAGTGIPTCVVGHTIKGKGVSFMENSPPWHSKVPTPEELKTALAELGEGGESNG